MRQGALLVFLVLAAVACTVDSGERCATDSDCDPSRVCNLYSNVCSLPELVCEANRDCGDPARPYCDERNECAPAPPVTATDVVDAGAEDVPTTPRDIVRPEIARPDSWADVTLPECPEPPATMLRATVFLLGEGNEAGDGLDLDGDLDTCSPAPGAGMTCAEVGGVDNALWPLATVANNTIEASVDNLELNVLFGAWPETPTTCPFLLVSRTGVATGTATDPFEVDPGAATPPCADGVHFEDGCLVDGTLQAGFVGQAVFPLVIELFGAQLVIPIHEARLVASTTGEGLTDGFTGVLAGVTFRADIESAIDELADFIPGGNTQGIKDLIFDKTAADMDTTGDGAPDAYSVGVRITTAPVTVDGFVD